MDFLGNSQKHKDCYYDCLPGDYTQTQSGQVATSSTSLLPSPKGVLIASRWNCLDVSAPQRAPSLELPPNADSGATQKLSPGQKYRLLQLLIGHCWQSISYKQPTKYQKYPLSKITTIYWAAKNNLLQDPIVVDFCSGTRSDVDMLFFTICSNILQSIVTQICNGVKFPYHVLLINTFAPDFFLDSYRIEHTGALQEEK